MGVISLRLKDSELKRIDDLSRIERKDRSTVARELIQYGWELVMLKQYRDGRLSLSSLSKQLEISVSETIDLLSEFGIEAPIAYEDYLKGFEVLESRGQG